MFNASLTLPAGISPVFSRRSMATSLAGKPASLRIKAAYAQTAPPPPDTRRIDFGKKPANFYEILSVKETASPAEIKTAYRTLAKRFHPDAVEGSDGRDFIQINQAYATLSDETAREEYDFSIGAGRRFRFSPVKSSGFGKGFQTRRWETDQCW